MERRLADDVHRHHVRVLKLAFIVITALVLLLIVSIAVGLVFALSQDKAKRRGLERETERAATELATGIALCASRAGALPESSAPVPPRFELVKNQLYRAEPSEWRSAAFGCAGFARETVGYQIRWLRTDSRKGSVVAIAKRDLWLDPVDFEAEVRVTCGAEWRCSAQSPPTLSNAPPGLETPP